MNIRSVLLGLSLVMTFVVSFSLAHNVFAANNDDVSSWAEYQKLLKERDARTGATAKPKARSKRSKSPAVRHPSPKGRSLIKASPIKNRSTRAGNAGTPTRVVIRPTKTYLSRPTAIGGTPSKSSSKPRKSSRPKPISRGASRKPVVVQRPKPQVASPIIQAQPRPEILSPTPVVLKPKPKPSQPQQTSKPSKSSPMKVRPLKQAGSLVGGKGKKTKPKPAKRPAPSVAPSTPAHNHDHAHNHGPAPTSSPDKNETRPEQNPIEEITAILMPMCGCTSPACRGTSPWDPHRMHPILHTVREHKGVDIGGPIGQDVRVAADGIVESSGSRGTLGKLVSVKHFGSLKNNKNQIKSENGFTTKYAHLSKIYVQQGDRVKKGQVIGAVGKTGRANGPHLHMELYIDGKDVNPMDYFELGSVSMSKPQKNTTKSCPAQYRDIDQPFRTQAQRTRKIIMKTSVLLVLGFLMVTGAANAKGQEGLTESAKAYRDLCLSPGGLPYSIDAKKRICHCTIKILKESNFVDKDFQAIVDYAARLKGKAPKKALSEDEERDLDGLFNADISALNSCKQEEMDRVGAPTPYDKE